MSIRILTGDCLDKLRSLPDESIHCAVTSPPYWGLRDYGVDGQLGLEPTLGEHIDAMVTVFREVRRVLRKDGTVWLNYGDCYATSPNGRSAADTKAAGNDDRTFRDKPFSTVGPIYRSKRDGKRWGGGNNSDPTLKAKDLCMVPQRLAIALQADGWWVRSLMPWAKRNGMPESINDRPASSVEYIILLSRTARYFYDAEAVKRAASPDTHPRYARGRSGSHKYANGGPGNQTISKGFDHMLPHGVTPKSADPGSGIRSNKSFNAATAKDVVETRNMRNADLFFDSLETPHGLVSDSMGHPLALDVPAAAFPAAHFATFPPALVEPCIKAGTSEMGVCSKCQAPWLRRLGKKYQVDGRISGNGFVRPERLSINGRGDETPWVPTKRDTVAWAASCDCNAAPVPATVLDPFGGAGTTALVADRLGRDAVLIELNPEYAEMARKRIEQDAGLYAQVEVVA